MDADATIKAIQMKRDALRREADAIDAVLSQISPAKPMPAPPHPVVLTEAAEKRFEALRAWRLQRARQDGLSLYIVAYDRSLRQVARDNPTTIEALQAIPGFGGSKAGKYGPEIFKVLSEA